ncbi:MAG TPA: glycosyltransferase family 39 protein [Pseudorhodoplanes sp.]|nr:glycosyltransferase family 39 protein [Pseudorhodoplanes sp.]
MASPVTDERQPGRFSALEWIAANPCNAFGLFAILHLMVWTALPALVYPNLPLDLIEALTYGREWQLGYDKLPPLPWWLVEIAYRAIGHDFAYYTLAQVTVLAAFALVWATARSIVGPQGALASVLIIDGLHYFNFTAPKFNHDVIQLPFWALAGFSLYRALRGGHILYWCLLGVAIGISLWAKYFVVILIAPLSLFLLLDRDARRSLATPGPWLAAVVAIAVMTPHLVWLVKNDFLPFAYASARAAPSRGFIDHVLHPSAFALSQIGFLLPSLLIALPLFVPWSPVSRPAGGRSFDFRFVTMLAFGPMAAILALSAVTGRGTVAMWGYPLWLFLGLWIVLVADRAAAVARLPRIVSTWAIVFLVYAVSFFVHYQVLPDFDHRYRATSFPGEAMANEISQRYRAIAHSPLVYVISSMWDGGNIGHYAPERPRVLIDGRPARAPWIDLSDLRSKGAAIVWTAGDLRTLPLAYRSFSEHALVQDPFEVPFHNGGRKLGVGWAIVPPQPHFANGSDQF